MFAQFLRGLLGNRRTGGATPVAPVQAAARAPNAAQTVLEGQQAEEDGRLDDALALYRVALEGFPGSAELHTKLGNLLRVLGRNREAIVAYRDAVKLNPDFAAAHNNLGVALCREEEVGEAIDCFCRTIAIEPGLAQAHENLGGIYFGQGRYAESLASYRQVVASQPDNGNALHMIAAMNGDNPERAPDQYVTKMFDGYADKFDAHLLLGLHYHTPQLLVAMVRECIDPALTRWDVLDLGCGTGLIGAQLAGTARHLVGVDLSCKMLEKARAKKFYHRLEEAEVNAMMSKEAAASYDVITSADVFIYIGKIDAVVGQATRLLRPGGVFAFSVESLDAGGNDYRLTSTGRYAHAAAYLERLAAAHGFVSLRQVSVPIRQERDAPVPGWLVLWQKPAAASRPGDA